MAHLCVLELTYVVDLHEVDEHLPAHRAWLERHYAAGTFLASGRKEPRSGGVILARGSADELVAVVAEDPFAVHGLATYRFTQFVPTMTADQLEPLRHVD